MGAAEYYSGRTGWVAPRPPPAEPDPTIPSAPEPGPGADGEPSAGGPDPRVGTVGLHDGIPPDQYHAHRDSLSASGAKMMLRAPALYHWERDHPAHKKVWDYGSAAHALVLGADMDSIYVAPYDDWRTKAAQEEQRIARADGLSPILPRDWLRVCDMAEAIASHTLALSLLTDGRPEVSAWATDETTGVLMRARFDYLTPLLLTDYKTTTCSEPGAFARNDVAKHGYHVAAAWYLEVARGVGWEAEAFAWVAQEKDEPYLVTVVELDYDGLARGAELGRRARERWRDCRASGVWPGYQRADESTRVSLPAWAHYDDGETA